MPETTEEEIKAKTAAILDALKKLIKETSKKTLETEKKSIKDADKEKSIFTTESWDDYQKALQEALLMPETTEEEMKAKTTAIQNALKKLIKQTTQSTLETEKKTTKDTEKEKSSFTAESWDDYQKALQKALLMPETTEEEIQAKTEAIKNALKKLIKSENKNALDAVKKSTTDIEKNKNDYTPDSWNAFQEALKAALALPETTDEEVRIKSEAIKNAMKKLIIDSTKKKTETGTNFIAVNNDFKGEIDMSTGSLTVTYYADTTQILGSVPIDNYYYPTKGTVVVRNNIGNLAGKEIRDGIRQRFIKWNSKPDGSGTDFLPGYSFQIVENTQFYAIFTTGNDVLRKVGVGGGWVFYDAGSKQSWGRYLEAANEDVTSSAWGKSNLIVKGADGIAIGTGQQNTIDIINSDAAEINKAADICYAYTTTFCGKTIDDWFLPSKDELNMLYLNLGRGRDENDVVYTIPAGITNGYYWSSSESDDRLAWLHYFKFGKQHAYYKQSAQGVRPIRAF
ncbi:MAG TPA: hypothetical protein DDY71_01470 [Spirochaetia bacterium]|nr:hypothetical protein [Spirochaetia bacterium]HBI36288.1 hypothetical protein [Spirochaetia bacterium]